MLTHLQYDVMIKAAEDPRLACFASVSWASGTQPAAIDELTREAKSSSAEADAEKRNAPQRTASGGGGGGGGGDGAFSSFPDDDDHNDGGGQGQPKATTSGMDYETITLMRMKHASDQLSREQKRKQALEELMKQEQDTK